MVKKTSKHFTATKILKAEENIDEENYHENIQTVYLCIHPLFFPKMYKRGEGWV